MEAHIVDLFFASSIASPSLLSQLVRCHGICYAPFGNTNWQTITEKKTKLESTMRPAGRRKIVPDPFNSLTPLILFGGKFK
jgi:hypothetical protein